ncbi:VCBS domain-containing protein, partial [Alteromonas lipolytica]
MTDRTNNTTASPALDILQLEQRLMFDGAAVATTAEVVAGPDTHLDDPVQDRGDSEAPVNYFQLGVAHDQTNRATELATSQIKAFLENASAEDLFAIFSGGNKHMDLAWLQAMEATRQDVLADAIDVQVLLVDNQTLNGALGAFSASGTDGQPTIYLNAGFIDQLGAEAATRVLVEEYGHLLDSLINDGRDTIGDEGQHFVDAVFSTDSEQANDNALNEDDHGELNIDGENIEVEWAKYSFVNAYMMVRDVDGDGIADNTENWAEKEQETHSIIISDGNYTNGLGNVTVDDKNYDSQYFSGNDVSAIGINIGGTDYFGWISRPLKIQGEVKGFYFWTDADFTDLATAQADGNQDGDNDVSDNIGFILVVDQLYFNSLSTSGLTVGAGSEAGSYTIAEVKSSSDRVDSQLNDLVDALAPNDAPVAANDTDTSAVELGTDRDDSPIRIITAGVDASGNVLSNDSDNNSDSLIVTEVAASVRGGTTSIAATGTTRVTGQYGTLSIGQDGAYTYAVDNTNTTIDALLNGTASDTFTYTIADGNGGFSTATLTITIQGSNDAPVASDDYNSAKESTTLAESGFTSSGYNASGNVLTNDNDVDTSDSLTITGLSAQGSADAATVTVNTGSYQLTFSSAAGASLGNKVAAGDELYVDLSNTGGNVTYYAMYYSADNGSTFTQVTATSAPVANVDGTYGIPLSQTPNYYWNGSAYVPISDPQTFLATHSFVSFEDSTSQTENASQGAQAQLQSSATTGSTELTGLSNLSGTIGIGMTVTGTGVPAGTTVTDVTYTNGVVTSVLLSSDKVTSTAGTSFSFSGGNGATGVTYQGAHGELVLQANGSYTYTANADNTAISEGDTVVDIFTYSMQDAAGETSEAQLIITVYGAGQNDSTAVSDAASATEQGYNTNTGTVLVNGVNPTGNLLSNDTGPVSATEFVVSVATDSANTNVGSGVVNQTITGTYGTLTLSGDGTYSYALDNTNSTVNALNSSQSLIDTFTYVVGNDLGSGLSSSQLVITIAGANDAPVAGDDTLSASVGNNAGGQVFSNDTDVDNNDTQTVIAATAGSFDDVSQANLPNETPVDSNGVTISGSYGTLTINANGTYTYAVDSNNSTVIAMTAAQNVTDTFTYRMEDADGVISDALISVTVYGSNDAPVNQFNGSSSFASGVETAKNTPYSFSVLNNSLIAVTDVDGDLSRVILAVDNGILNITGGSASITDNGTGRVIIQGSQAAINNALASLQYTPDTDFVGSDFLTIFSQDGENLYDSDGIAITVPEVYAGPTVLESDLASGSNASGTAESAAVTLTVPTDQSFVAGQSGSGSYGTWSFDASTGEFSYTLTGNADHTAGGVTDAITIQSYDTYGNVVSHTVNVAITDDAPVANNDQVSVTEGTAGAPAANLNGNVIIASATGDVSDTAGADAQLELTLVSKGNTSPVTPVASSSTSSSNGTEVTGDFGTLTIGADGSYSYDLNDDNTTVDALNSDDQLSDVFSYQITDADGSTSTATLTILILGATDGSAPTIDLGLSKTVDNATPNLGDNVSFTLTVSNTGPDTATNVVVTDQLPAGFTFVSSDGSYDSSTGLWTVGSLASGASATLTIVATTIDSSAVTNTASVTADQTELDNSDNTDSATVDAQAIDLAISKTVDNASPNLGDNVSFTLTVANTGPDAATNVVVTDQLPAGFTFVSSDSSYNATTGLWTVGSLASGASATLTIVATTTDSSAVT